ncbi:MAG: hypothetical protein KIT09_26070 [Bryobacteraceae bacterium]|nr:hypothetical protein [Bryobacteraceae bacterium]
MGRLLQSLAGLAAFFLLIESPRAASGDAETQLPANGHIGLRPPLLGMPPIPERAEIGAVAQGLKGRAELLKLNRIWAAAPSSGYTDLIRFHDRWYCTFREGSRDASPDGALRVISSPDGEHWTSAAVISYPGVDLRDPKFSLTPDRRLMLSAGMLANPSDEVQTLAWYSLDGRGWGEPFKIGEPGIWLWRVAWHRGNAYSMGYSTGAERFLRLYTGPEGLRFQTVADKAYAESTPTEATLLFRSDDSALCLVRRDAGTGTACLGISRPPYRAWQWRDLDVRMVGPDLIELPDRRVVAAASIPDGQPRMALSWLDPNESASREFLTLPSTGGNGYPGLAWHDSFLWVSYRSSHEGKSAIYLAQVRVPEPE